MKQLNKEETIHELCEQYYDKIYHYFYYRTRTPEDAEDLTHEVFIKMATHFDQQKGVFHKWLFTIAKNVLTDYYRSRSKRSSPLPLNLAQTQADTSEHTLNIETLKGSLTKLPKPQQEAILLKYMSDLTNQQIGDVLSKSEGAVKLLLFRAITSLRKVMVPS